MKVALYGRTWRLLGPRGRRRVRHRWARRGDHLVDQGLAYGELLAEIAGTPAPRTDDLFQTDGLARELLTHGPTEKALLVIDTDFGHIPRADKDILSDVGS
jgi:hypothetical protein